MKQPSSYCNWKGQISSKEYRVVKSFVMIMQRSPEYYIIDKIMEQEFITRYLESALEPAGYTISWDYHD